MPKRKFILSEDKLKKIREARDVCTNGMVRQRYNIILLYGMGRTVSEILTKTGLSLSTVAKIVRRYNRFGIEGLSSTSTRKRKLRLSPEQTKDIAAFLRSFHPAVLWGEKTYYNASGESWTIMDLKALLMKRYNISYKSASAYQDIFRQCDFVYHHKAGGYVSLDKAVQIDREGDDIS